MKLAELSARGVDAGGHSEKVSDGHGPTSVQRHRQHAGDDGADHLCDKQHDVGFLFNRRLLTRLLQTQAHTAVEKLLE